MLEEVGRGPILVIAVSPVSRGARYCGYIVVRVNFNSSYDSDCCDPVLAVALAGLRPRSWFHIVHTRAYLFSNPSGSDTTVFCVILEVGVSDRSSHGRVRPTCPFLAVSLISRYDTGIAPNTALF